MGLSKLRYAHCIDKCRNTGLSKQRERIISRCFDSIHVVETKGTNYFPLFRQYNVVETKGKVISRCFDSIMLSKQREKLFPVVSTVYMSSKQREKVFHSFFHKKLAVNETQTSEGMKLKKLDLD